MIREAFRPAVESLRRMWRPFLLIQCLAIGTAVAYYVLPGFADIADRVAAFRAMGGLLFSAIGTAIAGFLLPEIAKRATGHPGSKRTDAIFQIGFFAIIGVAIDLFYRGLGSWIGSGVDPLTVAKKVAIDQLLATPFGTMPYSVLAFAWHESGFSFRKTRERLAGGMFLRRYLRLLLTCWAFWVPVLAAVFAMPGPLQFVLFLFVQGAWSLLLVGVSRHRPAETDVKDPEVLVS